MSTKEGKQEHSSWWRGVVYSTWTGLTLTTSILLVIEPALGVPIFVAEAELGDVVLTGALEEGVSDGLGSLFARMISRARLLRFALSIQMIDTGYHAFKEFAAGNYKTAFFDAAIGFLLFTDFYGLGLCSKEWSALKDLTLSDVVEEKATMISKRIAKDLGLEKDGELLGKIKGLIDKGGHVDWDGLKNLLKQEGEDGQKVDEIIENLRKDNIKLSFDALKEVVKKKLIEKLGLTKKEASEIAKVIADEVRVKYEKWILSAAKAKEIENGLESAIKEAVGDNEEKVKELTKKVGDLLVEDVAEETPADAFEKEVVQKLEEGGLPHKEAEQLSKKITKLYEKAEGLVKSKREEISGDKETTGKVGRIIRRIKSWFKNGRIGTVIEKYNRSLKYLRYVAMGLGGAAAATGVGEAVEKMYKHGENTKNKLLSAWLDNLKNDVALPDLLSKEKVVAVLHKTENEMNWVTVDDIDDETVKIIKSYLKGKLSKKNAINQLESTHFNTELNHYYLATESGPFVTMAGALFTTMAISWYTRGKTIRLDPKTMAKLGTALAVSTLVYTKLLSDPHGSSAFKIFRRDLLYGIAAGALSAAGVEQFEKLKVKSFRIVEASGRFMSEKAEKVLKIAVSYVSNNEVCEKMLEVPIVNKIKSEGHFSRWANLVYELLARREPQSSKMKTPKNPYNNTQKTSDTTLYNQKNRISQGGR